MIFSLTETALERFLLRKSYWSQHSEEGENFWETLSVGRSPYLSSSPVRALHISWKVCAELLGPVLGAVDVNIWFGIKRGNDEDGERFGPKLDVAERDGFRGGDGAFAT